jgi:phosphatidylinositol alpha-1,6-mannosyltransferase
MAPVVQFVSKPVDPPINDGSKHIVTTLSKELKRYSPRVMATRDTRTLGDGIGVDSIYEAASHYAPSLLNNLRAVKHLGVTSRADIWHFVFAPNKTSSQMGRALAKLRRVPVLQTIASRPKVFDEPSQLLFGDIVVAQSEDTRRRFLEAFARANISEGKRPRIEVIAPPLGDVRVPTLEDTERLRQSIGVARDVPLILYPGDLEVSHGAARVGSAVARIVERHPTAVVVFAYRDKTANAVHLAAELAKQLERVALPERVRFLRETSDVLSLVRTSAALVFPVDELFGKVDVPIILLEAMALGTPVVTCGEGPLAELEGVERVPPDDAYALADVALSLIDDYGRRGRVVDAQLRTVGARFSASVVAAAYEGLYDDLLRGKGGRKGVASRL